MSFEKTPVPVEGLETGSCGLSAAHAAHDKSRREFAGLCARMSITLPPAVMLLASSDQALASIGAREEPSTGNGRGAVTDRPQKGGRGAR